MGVEENSPGLWGDLSTGCLWETWERFPHSRKDKLSIPPTDILEETRRGDCSWEAVRSPLRSNLQLEVPSRPQGQQAESRAHLHVYTSVRSLQVLHLT